MTTRTDDTTAVPGHPPARATITWLGATITPKISSDDTHGAFVLIEYTLPPYFDAFPVYWHRRTTEVCYVVSGTLACTLDDATITASPGTSFLVPPEVLHTVWNPTAAPAIFLRWCVPGGFERYCAEVAVLADPDASQVGVLGAKYDVWPPVPAPG